MTTTIQARLARRTFVFAPVLAAAFVLCALIPARAAVFTAREHVNVVNGDLVQITATNDSVVASHRITAVEAGSGPETWFGVPSNSIQVNFGEARNLKTIRVGTGFGGYKATSATIETSSNGVTWNAQAYSLNNLDATNQVFTLDGAVDAQYLRLTPTGFQQAPDNRWAVNQLRVYGDTGATLDPREHLDLMSSSAFPGGVSVSTIGSVAYEQGPLVDFTNDDPALLTRKVMYSVGTGDGFKLSFGENFDFRMLAVTMDAAGANLDANAAIKVSVSTDDLVYTTVYQNYTGPDATPTIVDTIDPWINYLPLTVTNGKYLKFEYVLSSLGDNRIADVMVFQKIPEPASLSILALGAAALLRRRLAV